MWFPVADTSKLTSVASPVVEIVQQALELRSANKGHLCLGEL